MGHSVAYLTKLGNSNFCEIIGVVVRMNYPRIIIVRVIAHFEGILKKPFIFNDIF